MSELKDWADRVLGRLNLSEKGQVDLFGDLARKTYEKAIKTKKTAITKLKSDLVDLLEEEEQTLIELKEDLISVTEAISVDSIKSVEARKNYFEVFDRKVSEAMSVVDSKEKYIISIEENVAKQIEKLNSEIKILETKLSFFNKK